MTMVDHGDGENVVLGRFWEQWNTNSYSAPQQTPLNKYRLAIGHCEVKWGQWPQVTFVDLETHIMQVKSHIYWLFITYWHQSHQLYPFKVNRTTPSCVFSRFRWNVVRGWSSYDVIPSWPDLTWPFFFCQKLREICTINYGKIKHDIPKSVASSSEKLIGIASTSSES